MLGKLCLKIVAISLVACLAQAVADNSYADDNPVYSIQAWKFQDRYIRHGDLKTFLDQINDEQAAKDATFVLIPGLRKPIDKGNCYTFRARYLPGYYLRVCPETWLGAA